MTEDAEPDVAEAGEVGQLRTPVEEWWSEPDSVLVSLVNATNVSQIRVPIRLYIGGGVISGLLVSMTDYFHELSTWIRSSTEEEAFGTLMGDIFSGMAEGEEMEPDDDDWRLTSARHVHLLKASLYTPGQIPLEVGFWRGRLASVNGWSYGTYSTGE